MSLENQLTEVRNQSAQNIPADILKKMVDATDALKAQALEQFAPKVGETLADFSLQNQVGETITLSEHVKNGPVVITFYRGGWCPYCNLELKAYQSVLPDIQAAGGSLLAITPERPDASLTTIEKNALDFTVLSDIGAAYAKSLGIVFTLPEEIKPIYSQFGINIEQHNGEAQFDLPLAATFVVDQNRTVIFADVNADYTQRAEPTAVVAHLAKMKG